MLTVNYQIKVQSDMIFHENTLLTALKDIHGCPTANFDGYISQISQGKTHTDIYCYTLEGPEDINRLSVLKQKHANWEEYRKNAVLKAFIKHLEYCGYTWTLCEILGPI